jgi:beta-xylosidase
MVEAVMLWNEPNNLSHWDFKIDPEWKSFAEMCIAASRVIREINPDLKIILGGISPIDPNFIELLTGHGVIDAVDVVAVHGFPLDWNHWSIHEWPKKIDEIRAVTAKPVWVTEVGASSFGAEEVQDWGMRKTAELLLPVVERVYWYSLFDLPASWSATTRHKEAEGSSYYRHYYMGLLREDGTPKPAAKNFPEGLGICQWFHFEDHRLDDAVRHLRDLGVRHLRTGLSWSDSLRPNAEAWFDRQMRALEPFDVTLTFCFTPNSEGLRPDHTSPPRDIALYAGFCARMIRRYGM